MKTNLFRFTSYMGGRVHHVFDGFTRELSENRVILNWMYCLAYLALIFYCATTNPASHSAAIYTTGGIVSTIFTVYILGSSYEKVQRMKQRAGAKDATVTEAPEMDEKAQEQASGD